MPTFRTRLLVSLAFFYCVPGVRIKADKTVENGVTIQKHVGKHASASIQNQMLSNQKITDQKHRVLDEDSSWSSTIEVQHAQGVQKLAKADLQKLKERIESKGYIIKNDTWVKQALAESISENQNGTQANASRLFWQWYTSGRVPKEHIEVVGKDSYLIHKKTQIPNQEYLYLMAQDDVAFLSEDDSNAQLVDDNWVENGGFNSWLGQEYMGQIARFPGSPHYMAPEVIAGALKDLQMKRLTALNAPGAQRYHQNSDVDVDLEEGSEYSFDTEEEQRDDLLRQVVTFGFFCMALGAAGKIF